MLRVGKLSARVPLGNDLATNAFTEKINGA
jgi:hypothetical protein